MFRSTTFLRWLTLSDMPDQMAVARYAQVRRDLPVLAAIIAIDIVAIAGVVAANGSLAVAMAVTAVALWRTVRRAWRGAIIATYDAATSIRRMRRLILLAVPAASAQVAIVLLLHAARNPGEGKAELLGMLCAVAAGVCLIGVPQVVLVLVTILVAGGVVHHVACDLGALIVLAPCIAATIGLAAHVLRREGRSFDRLVLAQAGREADEREAARLSAENAQLANLDSLTELPNRRYFLAQLDALAAQRGATDEPFAVGLLDLDRFKPVNDIYGHLIGDRLLAMLGERLAAAAGDGLLIARLGGDEFGIVIPSCEPADESDPAAIGAALCAIVSEPYRIDDIRISVGCSCGIALFPDAGRSAREIFDRADYALYNAKSRRGGGCTVFSADHEQRIRSAQVLDAALQTADFAAEMNLHFQPIIDTHSLRVVGVEALARWTSPVLGVVQPGQFIPAAESLGLIGAISLALFGKALAQVAVLPDDIYLSFNFSAIDIATPATTAALIAQIETSGADPRRIVIEITETAVMRDFDEATATIERLRALGCRVALDDFGTGFSSLTHLRRLAPDRVKVDGSFAAGLDEPSGRKIVAAIADLCRTLEIDCVIEGIETAEQLLRIRQFGYRFAQGYLFARPMPMANLRDWLAVRPLEFSGMPEASCARLMVVNG